MSKLFLTAVVAALTFASSQPAQADTLRIDAADGVGNDTFTDFAGGDRVDLTGLAVASGLGTSTVVFDNGAVLVATNGHLWAAGDFT